MAGQPGGTDHSVDDDGVRTIADPNTRAVARWLTAGVAVVVIAVVVAITVIRFAPGHRASDATVDPADLLPRPAADARAPRVAAAPAPAPSDAAPAAHVVPRKAPKPEPPTPPFDGDPPPEKPAPMFEFGPAGEKTGVALFPPPGTNPLKRGIVVPDDFELPPGYVRHYQNTDDGKQLPPILMFHPDYQLVDENGRPVPQPKDGIVPPEMAPPGMPVQMLEPPPLPKSDH